MSRRPPFRRSPSEFMSVLRYNRSITAEELESAQRALARFDETYPEAADPTPTHDEQER